MNADVSPAAKATPKHPAVYVIALIFCLAGASSLYFMLSFFSSIGPASWDDFNFFEHGSLYGHMLTNIALNFASAATVFMMRKETLLFQGWIMASAISSAFAYPPGAALTLLIPLSMTALTLWLAVKGKLR